MAALAASAARAADGRVALDGGAIERHIAIVDVDPPTLTVAAIGSGKARGALDAASRAVRTVLAGVAVVAVAADGLVRANGRIGDCDRAAGDVEAATLAIAASAAKAPAPPAALLLAMVHWLILTVPPLT